MTKITKEQAEYLAAKIESEGFDYLFICYSSFEKIEDEKFHELRKKYVEAHNEFESYLDKVFDLYELEH